MDVLEASKLDSLVVLYQEESDVLLWKDFVTAEARKRFKAPVFVRVDGRGDYEFM